MNNTKWEKLISEINVKEDYSPHVRIKYLYDLEPPEGFSPVWWDEVKQFGYKRWSFADPLRDMLKAGLNLTDAHFSSPRRPELPVAGSAVQCWRQIVLVRAQMLLLGAKPSR